MDITWVVVACVCSFGLGWLVAGVIGSQGQS
jgi:hypothetical protein